MNKPLLRSPLREVLRDPNPLAVIKGARVAFFDALSASALPSWLTLTRASIGQYFDAAPLMQTAAINAARFDHDLTGAARGLLIEGSANNSALYSADISNAAWSAVNNSAKTPNYATAPDGTLTAARVLLSAGTQVGTNFQQAISGANLGANQTHQISAFVKSNVASVQPFSLKLTQAAVEDHFSPDLLATSVFQRFSFSQAFVAGGGGFRAGIASASGGTAADLVVWGLQLEINTAAPSSFIFTTGSAVTRSADAISIGAGYSNNPVVVETMSVATGAISRTLHNPASGISALSGVWLRKAAVYRIGTPASVLNAVVAGGAW